MGAEKKRRKKTEAFSGWSTRRQIAWVYDEHDAGWAYSVLVKAKRKFRIMFSRHISTEFGITEAR